MNLNIPSLRQSLTKQLNNTRSTISGQARSLAESRLRNYIKSAYQFLGNQSGVIVIIVFVIIGNFSQASAQQNQPETNSTAGDLAGFAPEQVADITMSISKYVPNLNVSRDRVVTVMAMQADAQYVNAPDSFDTQVASVSSDQQFSANRQQVVLYVVQPGDILSVISERFSLKSATLQFTNKLDNADSIEPGLTLKIPTQDMSDAAIAKAQSALDNSQQVAYANSSRNTVARSGSYASSFHFIVPINSMGISQGFGWGHTGIDYEANVGTPVRAAASGKVINAQGFGWNGGWGKNIVVDHGSGRTTRYAHLSQLAVSNGEWVTQGEVIGYSGNTGHSTGPHLHFQLDVYGVPTYPF